MTNFRSLRWPLIIGLGVFALIRPLYRILEAQLDFDGTRRRADRHYRRDLDRLDPGRRAQP